MAFKSFYDQISENKWKSYLLIGLVLALVFIAGWFIAYLIDFGPSGIFIAFFLSILYSVGGYYFSDKLVLAATGAKEVQKSEYPHLFNTVEGLAIAAGIPKPRLYMIEDSSPNAFATGRDPQHSAIAVTRGLVELMNREELEGVLAHEMSHIQNYDIRFGTIAVVLVGMVGIISNLFFRYMWFFGGGRSRDSGRGGSGNLGALILILGILFMILAPLAAQLVRLAISRKREFLADASGAKLTRNPDGLASALEKLGKSKKPMQVPESSAPLFIVNPFAGKFAGLFSTHPPLEERVKALRAM